MTIDERPEFLLPWKRSWERRRVHAGRAGTMTLPLWFCLALLTGVSSWAKADDLPQSFLAPPAAARPWVYWYFMDGHLTREGMTADLESMKQAGIGGGIFLEVNIGIPRGPVDFMSEPWRELLRHAGSEAERLGLALALGAGPGWCGTGGPWVKPEQSMQHLVASETNLRGPQHFDGLLPQPPPRTPFFGEGTLTPELKRMWQAFYRDVTVVAYPTPAGDYRIPDVDEKALFYRAPYTSSPGVKPRLRSDTTRLPPEQCIAVEQVIELADHLAEDGRLTWDVPEGDWTILRLGRTLTGQVTRPAPQPGLGLESDKFDPAALDAHFEHFLGSLFNTTGEPKGTGAGFTQLHFDSWEMSSQNWSESFREQFRDRRGYDPVPYLPAMFGHPVGSVEIAERFLWDLRRTAQELVLQNHVMHLKELGREHHLVFSSEPYDMNPAGDLLLSGVADVPMCEFWSRGYGFSSEYSCFEAVSAAHTQGREIIGAEAFTSSHDQWRQYPWAMKQQGDWALCSGINRFVFHRFQHQPTLDQSPGMTFGMTHGVHWERTQTWWDMAEGYHGYLTRCQAILRRGLPVADILYLDVEDAPAVFTPPPSATLPGLPDHRGYTFDGCAPDTLIARARAEDGRIVFPDGMSYRLLVLPDVDAMSLALVRTIGRLTAGGVPVVGRPPVKAPGLTGYPGIDAEVRREADASWQNLHLLADPVATTADLAEARWIWHQEGRPAADAPVGTRWFQRDIEIPAGVASASLTITADNLFDASINGRPALTGDNFHQLYTRDVTSLLTPGTNRLRVRVDNEGTVPNPAGMIATLSIRQPDGRHWAVVTDGHWRSGLTETRATTPALELGAWNREPWNLARSRPLPEIYPDYTTTAGMLGKLGIPPDFESDADLRYIHRHEPDAEVYFVGNRTDSAVSAACTFRVSGLTPERWDPVTGEQYPLPEFREEQGRTLIPLEFAPAQTFFIVFRKGTRAAGVNFPPVKSVAELSGPWAVSFDSNWGGPDRPVTFETLEDWTKRPEPGIRYYSGKATYGKRFGAPAEAVASPAARLDLGVLNHMARVELNGRNLGVVWCAPWQIAVPPALLKATDNDLRIQVANLWPNRLIKDAGLPEDQRLTRTTWNPYQPGDPLLPSGLLGPVTLVIPAGQHAGKN